ncbi:MAG: hypothetical protein SF172_04190 [Burkholderiales bacterium]|nr:hypothetical protein [Burkholderiales bacterium]
MQKALFYELAEIILRKIIYLSSTEALQQLTDVFRRKLEFMNAAMQTEQHWTGA